jgi:hypothetical protein
MLELRSRLQVHQAPGLLAMLTLATTCFLLGAMLALRFTVWILVPVISLGLLFALGIGLAHNYAFGTIGLAAVLIALGLQFGYLAVIGTDYVLSGWRRHRRAQITPVSRPAH